ncbi:MAG: hypothetical protein QNK03_27240 [Myxococcota bacterium]|nr:hypothetical protein [Myxococcota bacterium]
MSDEAGSKFDQYFGLAKFLIGTVGLGLVTLQVNSRIQQREVDIKEIALSQENLSRYIELAIDKDLSKRRDFAQYFAHLSLSQGARDKWKAYVAFVDQEIERNKQSQEQASQGVDDIRSEIARKARQLESEKDASQREELTAELARLRDQLNVEKLRIAQLREELSGSSRDVQASESLRALVLGMDSPRKQERLNATRQLVDQYPGSPSAVEEALRLLSEPYLNELSANGRVNVLVYLVATEAAAWTPRLLRRWDAALETMKQRDEAKIAALGPLTRERLEKAARHIDGFRPVLEQGA